MDERTRQAVEHLEWLARPGVPGLTDLEKGNIQIVLSALAESEGRLSVYKADRAKWKEATFIERYRAGE
jgi:hypothetical protein